MKELHNFTADIKDQRTRSAKLLFFQSRYDAETPRFLLAHKREHVSCLARFFDVSVVNEDCDYGEMCERHEPDLVLFETGVEIRSAHRLNIGNLQACPDIPRIALSNADGGTELRPAIISDLEHWNAEAVFTISVVGPEHMPNMAIPMFVWPNAIDTSVHHDRKLPKAIPVLITGSQSPRYPWRRRVFDLIQKTYPTLICPHGGYETEGLTRHMLSGEPYASLINSSIFSPTCGSVTNELVRKHLEIPGNRSCLISERSPSLTAAGFEDMINCIFADSDDILEKIEHLLRHPELLEQITTRGYDLVHSRHTLNHRGQILEWYKFRSEFGSNVNIVQEDPFSPLRIADNSQRNSTFSKFQSGSCHLKLLREGEDLFECGRYSDAEAAYRRILSLLSEFPEAKFKIALCRLRVGKPREALSLLIQTLRCSLLRYGAYDPDPVEWAYLIVCLLCLGRLRAASVRAAQFPSLRHVALDSVRNLCSILTGCDAPTDSIASARPRATIHAVPAQSRTDWSNEICSVLLSCGRADLVAILRNFESVAGTDSLHRSGFRGGAMAFYRRTALGLIKPNSHPNLIGRDNPQLWQTLKSKGVQLLCSALHRVEDKVAAILAPRKIADHRTLLIRTSLRRSGEQRSGRRFRRQSDPVPDSRDITLLPQGPAGGPHAER